MKLYHCVSLLRDSCGAVSMSWNWAATQEHVDVWKKILPSRLHEAEGVCKEANPILYLKYCLLGWVSSEPNHRRPSWFISKVNLECIGVYTGWMTITYPMERPLKGSKSARPGLRHVFSTQNSNCFTSCPGRWLRCYFSHARRDVSAAWFSKTLK